MPFDEDEKDKKTWFLDMDYLESMYGMFRKVSLFIAKLTLFIAKVSLFIAQKYVRHVS